nr:hypothetical protein [Tanacetum cinerariifolium]
GQQQVAGALLIQLYAAREAVFEEAKIQAEVGSCRVFPA